MPQAGGAAPGPKDRARPQGLGPAGCPVRALPSPACSSLMSSDVMEEGQAETSPPPDCCVGLLSVTGTKGRAHRTEGRGGPGLWFQRLQAMVSRLQAGASRRKGVAEGSYCTHGIREAGKVFTSDAQPTRRHMRGGRCPRLLPSPQADQDSRSGRPPASASRGDPPANWGRTFQSTENHHRPTGVAKQTIGVQSSLQCL